MDGFKPKAETAPMLKKTSAVEIFISEKSNNKSYEKRGGGEGSKVPMSKGDAWLAR